MEGERGKQGITLEGAATKKKSRNSSIELLRLISMLMIVSLHFVQSTDIGEWIARQPTSCNKFIYQCVFMSGGWVGNFVFFAISVWFLLEGKPTFRECLKRIWIMERQLLFLGYCSLCDFCLCAVSWIDRN
ncbi:hypothetical protein ACTQ4A_00385 [Bifidobacterium pseudolongum]|uniref:hypothetical protein n=1 Tax=Bifidobacterium pseudolongum TaxID=1694 RepID=UPI003F92E743